VLVIALVGLACPRAEPAGARPDAAPPEVATPTPTAAAALPPLELDCAVDADCALSGMEIVDGACCHGCLTQVANTRWKQRAEAFCQAHPGDSCPKKRCGSAAPPKCRNGKCTNDG
jgi:hypothetical protein